MTEHQIMLLRESLRTSVAKLGATSLYRLHCGQCHFTASGRSTLAVNVAHADHVEVVHGDR